LLYRVTRFKYAITQTATGDVYSAGSNGHGTNTFPTNKIGQLGRDENIAEDGTFRVIEALRGKHIIKISAHCGCAHALALSSHGHVYTWGANFKSYSLGLQNPQDPEYPLAPTKICTPTEIISLRNKGYRRYLRIWL
jgi:alpha-tubulin suppressor-like RCC1 family protein